MSTNIAVCLEGYFTIVNISLLIWEWNCTFYLCYLERMNESVRVFDPVNGLQVLPKQLAIPWYYTSQRLGLKPIICQAAMVLSNYIHLDASK